MEAVFERQMAQLEALQQAQPAPRGRGGRGGRAGGRRAVPSQPPHLLESDDDVDVNELRAAMRAGERFGGLKMFMG